MFEDYFDELRQQQELLKQLAYSQSPSRSPAGAQIQPKTVPQAPAGTAPFYDLEHQTVTNTVAPVAPQFREELQNELNKMRGIDDARNVYSFEKQKEGLQDLTSQIEQMRGAPEAKPDMMVPLLGAAQWFASPSGTQPEILGTYKMMKDLQSRKDAERRELIEKLMALKQKQEQGIANSDVAYLKAMIPQIMQGREIVTEKGGYKPVTNQSGRNQMPLDARAFRDVQKEFERNTGKFNQSLDYANAVSAFIKNAGPGQKLTQKAIEPLLARASSEVGNLSSYEQIGKTEARDILSRLSQRVSTLVDSELTPENKAAILDLSNQYRGVANGAIDLQKRMAAERGAQAYKSIGLGKGDFEKALPTRQELGGGQGVTSPNPAPSGMTRVKNISTGQVGFISVDKVDAAVKSGKFEAVK